jgi:tRNA(fMet)-specific endonuclease VapC
MRHLLDTSAAIALRDLDLRVRSAVAALESAPLLSILSVVELEGGVVSDPIGRDRRRTLVDSMLTLMEVLSFGVREAATYRNIVEQVGFSRPRIIDRMIAAQAIVADATLITLNPRDFRGIPGLNMEDWSA